MEWHEEAIDYIDDYLGEWGRECMYEECNPGWREIIKFLRAAADQIEKNIGDTNKQPSEPKEPGKPSLKIVRD